MANTREIRRRIKSIKNTAQITKAMQLVAASKMRRAQQVALAGREYATLLNRMLVSLKDKVESTAHPLLEHRQEKKQLVLVISTDKGLCGGLNTNLFREINELPSQSTAFIATGKKAAQFLTRTHRDLLADFVLKDTPSFRETKSMSKYCIEQFLEGKVDKVSVLYTQFINTLNQKPSLRTLLPLTSFEEVITESSKGVSQEDNAKLAAAAGENTFGYLFEPSAEAVLETLLPEYIHFQIYQMVLEARASEHSARMVAMKSATDNANQLVKDLTLEYNKVRQAAITTELLEISTAQAVLG